MVKLFVTETAQRVALEGMQMMGGYGYSSEHDMERLVRATLVSPSTVAPPRSSAESSRRRWAFSRSPSTDLAHRLT
jgi:alkylation response protein AidB-like acyl-CoA dehydrogenase